MASPVSGGAFFYIWPLTSLTILHLLFGNGLDFAIVNRLG